LSVLTNNEDYRRRATAVLRLLADQVRRHPSAFGLALTAIDFYLGTPVEVAVVGRQSDARLPELLRAIWQTYLPNRVIALCTEQLGEAARLIPLLLDRDTLASEPTAFVCQNYTCQTPAHTGAALGEQLSKAVAQPGPSTN